MVDVPAAVVLEFVVVVFVAEGINLIFLLALGAVDLVDLLLLDDGGGGGGCETPWGNSFPREGPPVEILIFCLGGGGGGGGGGDDDGGSCVKVAEEAVLASLGFVDSDFFLRDSLSLSLVEVLDFFASAFATPGSIESCFKLLVVAADILPVDAVDIFNLIFGFTLGDGAIAVDDDATTEDGVAAAAADSGEGLSLTLSFVFGFGFELYPPFSIALRSRATAFCISLASLAIHLVSRSAWYLMAF